MLEFIYMGDIFRTRLRVAGTDEFVIKTRNAPDQRRLKPGEMIEIGWMAEDCRALDASQRGTSERKEGAATRAVPVEDQTG